MVWAVASCVRAISVWAAESSPCDFRACDFRVVSGDAAARETREANAGFVGARERDACVS